jgi:hypothetical protein
MVGYVSLSEKYSNSSNWYWLSGWGRYVESEILEQSVSVRVLDYKATRSLVSIYWFVYSWGLMLILQTLVHLFIPLGILSSMPYHVSYWLFGSALGLFLCVYVCMGVDFILMSLDRGLRDNFFVGGVSVVPSRLFYRTSVMGGVFNRSLTTCVLDVLSVTSLVRGAFPLLNWVYQVSYFGVRLFLVFVLHSFCLSCFGELYTTCCDQCMVISWPVGGLIGLGIALSLLMVLYLGIQIYVYISFSIGFMYKTMLSYFRVDKSNTLDICGPQSWLVPVSLVDLFPTHYYYWLIMWLSSNLLLSRVWMSVYGGRSTYVKLSSQHQARIARPIQR